jgi:hypothetical protein
MPDRLRDIKLTTRTREELAVALPQCWRTLRLAGFSRSSVLYALARAWKKGDIRIDPFMPVAPAEPRVTVHARPRSR